MRILNVQQGTPEWHEIRAKHFTASEAPAMMGDSKHMKRNELLHMKATGEVKPVSDTQLRIYDKGHATEALARPIIEAKIEDELFTATGVDEVDGLPLLASFDGLDMGWQIVFEHKLLNESLVQQVKDKHLEPHYYWQLEHQLLVSGAEQAIFVTSDGTEPNLHWMYYESHPTRREKLIAGWKQFAKDLSEYQPPEAAVETEQKVIQELPAIHIDIQGKVEETNIALYKDDALKYIKSINTELESDQDFADAEQNIKFCKAAEEKLDLAKSAALSKTASIDEVMKNIEFIKEQFAVKRKQLDKLVKDKKAEIKNGIIGKARDSLHSHCFELSKELPKGVNVDVVADFSTAAKNKRTLDSIQNAVDTALAQAKIEAGELATLYRNNAGAIPEEFAFLFSDLPQIIGKSTDDFANLVSLRVSQHKEREEEKAEEPAPKQSTHSIPSSGALKQYQAQQSPNYIPLQTWPSDQDRADNELLNEVCAKLEEAEDYIAALTKREAA